MVDQNIIHARIEKMRESAARLRPLAILEEQTFCGDADSRTLAERHLQIAIAGRYRHRPASRRRHGSRTIQDYRDVFRILVTHRIIPEPLARKLESMTGMRNVLVHDYLRVDLTGSIRPYKTTSKTSTNSSLPFSS
jgi:uncharacterized protein YutE (UPF0331/DUF86 family)